MKTIIILTFVGLGVWIYVALPRTGQHVGRTCYTEYDILAVEQIDHCKITHYSYDTSKMPTTATLDVTCKDKAIRTVTIEMCK